MKLSVVIPVYNEEKTIREVILRVSRAKLNKEIIIVDDGSSDATPSILKELESEEVSVYLLSENAGKAAAVRYGIDKAGGDLIIIQDADLEYDPDDYPALLAPIEKGEADAVYGNRFPLGGENMFLRQKLANKFLTVLTGILYGSDVGDMETCYKVIPSKILKSMELVEENFDIEAEVTAKLLKKGIRIASVPINYKGRGYSEGKKIKFRDALRAVKVLFKYRFKCSA